MGQMASSFSDAKEILQKLCGIEISESQIQKITEEVGKAVFEKEVAQSNLVYNAPEKHMPSVPEKEQIEICKNIKYPFPALQLEYTADVPNKIRIYNITVQKHNGRAD